MPVMVYAPTKEEGSTVSARSPFGEPMPPGAVSTFLEREFVKPYSDLASRYGRRLSESGEAVLSLPSVVKAAIQGEADWRDAATVLRAAGAPFEPIFGAVGEGVGWAAEQVGVPPKAAEVVGTLGELSSAIALPFAPTGTGSVARALARFGIGRTPEKVLAAERATQAVPELVTGLVKTKVPRPTKIPKPPTLVEPTTPTPPPQTGPVAEVSTQPPIPKLVQNIVSQETEQRALDAAGKVFEITGIKRDRDKFPRLIDQVMDLMEKRLIDPDAIGQLYAQQGIDFKTFLRDGARYSGQFLNRLSRLAKRIQGLPGADELVSSLAELESLSRPEAVGWGLVRRLDNVRRGMLVTQVATAMRNAEVQVGRIGLDVLQAPIDSLVQKFLNIPGKIRAHPLDGLEIVGRLFSRGNKKQVEDILREFPSEYDRLFGTYSSDIVARARAQGTGVPVVEQAVQMAEGAVDVLNTLNRGQEFLHRRAVFIGRLDQALRKQGKVLADVIARNEVGAIDENTIRGAVDSALEFTFAKSPAYGTFASDFIRIVNRSGPVLSIPIPFPRFMVNSMKFFWDFSPFGATRLLSPKQWEKIAAGDVSTISRATLGTGLLGAAWQLRNSEYAGEKWYEAKYGDRRIDLRPFNPFAAYLFVADIIKRHRDGTLDSLDMKDVAQGVLSANMRAGAGLYLVDQLLDSFTTMGDWQKAKRSMKGLAGEVAAGFLMPLQTLKDIMSEFDESLKVVREKRAEPFMGPIKAAIPGISHTLPEAESPTRTGPMMREYTGLRQATGVIVGQKKNPLELELDRLGFKRREIITPTGNPDLDRTTAHFMGPISEKILVPIVSSPGYRAIKNDSVRAEILRRSLNEVEGAARQLATQTMPREAVRQRYERYPRRLRKMIEGRSVGRSATRAEVDQADVASGGDLAKFEKYLRDRGINPDLEVR